MADQTCYLTQSHYTDTGLTIPSADPINGQAPGKLAIRVLKFLSHCYDSAWEKRCWNPGLPLLGHCGKVSASRAAGRRSLPPLSLLFPVKPYHWLRTWHTLPTTLPDVIGSVIGLVSPVSVHCTNSIRSF